MNDQQDDPIFLDDWKDERERSRYLLHAREVYTLMKELRADSRRYHVEYGKWLIASMLALHAGAIFAISGLRDGANGSLLDAIVAAISWNIGGIVAIIMAGFMAWLNFQLAEVRYDQFSNPAMLYRRDHWPYEAESRTDPITATLFLAAAFGAISLWCLVASAMEATLGLRLSSQ